MESLYEFLQLDSRKIIRQLRRVAFEEPRL